MSATRVHELFDTCVARGENDAFLYFPDRTLSFGEVDAMTRVAQAELRERGVVAGDRVMVVAENCAEHIALIVALSRCGAWACGVNARMAPGEIAGFIEASDPRLVYFTRAASAAAAAHSQGAGAVPSALAALSVAPGSVSPQPVDEPLASGVAAMIFTSGTTGKPKGVLMTHAGLIQFAEVSARSRGLGEQDRSYAYVPMTHVFGLGTVLMASLYARAGLVMRTQFGAADVLDALANEQVSNLQGPPAMFSRLMAHMQLEGINAPLAPALRYVYTGAGPMDLSMKREVEARFGMPLHHGYGLSEYAGAVCVTRMNEVRDDTSAGYCVEGVELRVVDADGKDLPRGERGEIWIRGVGLFPGYFRDKAATRAVMRSGGWYATGDIGQQDADGALSVVGRLKEMIIRSGFNVYPAEVEATLNAFPAVLRSAVIGVPEPDGNERIHAFVELRPTARLDAVALKRHMDANLAPYKHPAAVHTVQSLPMTLSGKVLKRELAATLGS